MTPSVPGFAFSFRRRATRLKPKVLNRLAGTDP
jgi:hypothetical protein